MIKGLCVDDKIGEAVGLFKKMGLFGCWPDVVTYEILINGLC
jgi:pentatricopeptide repeat protein